MSKPVSRRFFVWALGLIGAGGAVPTLLAGGPPALAGRSALLQNQLAALFGDTASARAIGRVYLRERAGETDPARLAAALHDVVRPGASVREMKQKCREDFAAGNIVTVQGWVLARTEAQLCALAAIA